MPTNTIQFVENKIFPQVISDVISLGLATLHELQTVYGTYDAHRLREIGLINKYNDALIKQQQSKEQNG